MICRQSANTFLPVLVICMALQAGQAQDSRTNVCARSDRIGNLQIHEAANLGKIDALRSLAQRNPSQVDARNARGWTPLHCAVAAARDGAVDVLLRAGAKPYIGDSDGATPLHLAVGPVPPGGSIDAYRRVIDLLIQGHADLQARDKNGDTPLHVAIQQGDRIAVQLLLQNKAATDAKDNRGLTPLQIAQQVNRAEIQDLVRAATPVVNAVAQTPRFTQPSPDIALSGKEEFADPQGKKWLRYRVNVRNYAAYPASLFTPAPQLPPCGQILNSPQTWVDIFVADHTGDPPTHQVNNECSLRSPADLQNLTFAVPQESPQPCGIVVQLRDRVNNQLYRSAPLPLACDESAPFKPGNGVSVPTVLDRVEAQYTEAARAAKVSGTVTLECLVHKDGSVTVNRIVRGIGYGLDENAKTAIERWRFRPGMRDGSPIDVLLNIEVNFNLK
jgi:TonB family protein